MIQSWPGGGLRLVADENNKKKNECRTLTAPAYGRAVNKLRLHAAVLS